VVGVYFEGTAKRLETGEEQDLAAACLKDRIRITDDLIGEAATEEGHQLYKVTVTNWYVFGRFGDPSGQKYKLEWNQLPT
jgi:hypothetical protein